MSHDGIWRAACLNRSWIRILHFEVPSVARGVTDVGVGSGALLGRLVFGDECRTSNLRLRLLALPLRNRFFQICDLSPLSFNSGILLGELSNHLR
jgi:hypothetical protein